MKKPILTIAAILFIAAAIFSSCQPSSSKTEDVRDKLMDAKDKVLEADQELNLALKDSIQQFRKESEEKINDYERSIAELKVKIAKEKKENKAIYEEKLAGLEQKNKELKRKLNEYKEEGIDDWKKFKTEFSNDMDELGKAFKDFTINNAK